MRYVQNPAIRPLFLEGSYCKRQSLKAALPFLSLLTVTFLFASIITTLTASLSIYERAIIHNITLILSIMFFITLFWKETGGDFFAFINLVLIWYFVMFAIPVFFVLYFPQSRIKASYWSISSLEYSIWIVIISLYSLSFGYKLAGENRRRIILPLSLRPSIRRMKHVVCICIALYLIYLFVKSYAMGTGIWTLLEYEPRGSEYTERKYFMGIYTLINLLRRGPGYIFLLCFILPRNRDTSRAWIICANLFILFYILHTFLFAIISTSKSTAVGLIFLLLVLMHYTKRKIRLIEAVAIFLFGVLVLTIFNYRRIPSELRHRFDTINVIPVMYAQSFEEIETLCMVTSHFPQAQQYYYGKRLLEEIAYLPIPRAFWKEKPIAYGTRAIFYDIDPKLFVAGEHVGLQSQFYADFGLWGVIIGFIIFGWLIGWTYNIFRQNLPNKGIILMYILVIDSSWLYLKGGFPWLNLFIVSFVPFYILLRYIYPIKIRPPLKQNPG